MKQQQGVALVIVMALLAGALMLGMSGMRSALIDERLAGNYRASVQAQMSAESMLSVFRSMASRRQLLEGIFNATYTESDFLNDVTRVEGFESFDQLSVTFDVIGDEVTITTRDMSTNSSIESTSVAVYQRASQTSGAED
ncbi:PilX N-terminal domain-containing pilus assembly protein [Vreelandella sp. F11]|uniref:pilus assembly PilX family protein n=1 Tax=Vreelandella sp. F11 TaxID=3394751 RepID=UPI0036DCF021